jgi:hypothetical protein
MSTTVPSFTFATAGNIRASASLAVIEAIITVLNTPGGTIAATRGVRIDIFNRYASGPTTSASAFYSTTLPSATASTAETATIRLPPGKYNIKITNLDATNAVVVEITGDTWVFSTT